MNRKLLRRPAAIDALAVAALIVLTILLYRKVLNLWLTYDDANILRLTFDYPFLDIFTNGRVWPQQLFTPLLLAAFHVMRRLFGFDPSRFYVMQLAVGAMTVVLVYAAVRQFLDWQRALSAAALFALGVPLCSVVVQLSTIHYFLAIDFCALAVIAYAAALRRPSVALNVVSVLCYALAMLAKEVAIPLPLLLIALPIRDARTRVRFVIGHGVAAIAYFLWRRAVLGVFLGAYGWQIDAAEWPRLLALLPLRIMEVAAGAGLAAGLLVIVLMTLTIAFAMRSRRALMLLVAAIVLAAAPLIPLAKEVSRRYVAVPWLAWSVGFAAAVTRRNDRVAAALLVAVPLLAIVPNRAEWRKEFPLRRRMSDEARFYFYDMPPGGLLRNALVPPAALGEVQWLKTVHFGRPAGGWFYDDIFLCSGGAGSKQVFEFEGRQIVDITPRINAISKQFCGSIRNDAPLAAAFHFRNPALHWDLGPYADGKYSAVIANGIQAFEIPRRDALKLPGMPGITLRIRYDSPAGWTTYSPELAIDFAHKPDVTWHR
ncbi:MAG: glycosyltransferase family 39 protein [Acidobacteria bacterium]|nr:glycosyltransferase family 39 protein [Acidobacteriota bacterium]MBV9187849.1 glycosyltransferase family 39 protein [Acidobacteriota bacterium]